MATHTVVHDHTGRHDPLDPIQGRAPLVLNNQSFAQITDAVAAPLEQASYKGWWMGFGAAVLTLGLLLVSVGYLVWEGTGIWGIQNPVGWGWAIVNFVFWVGIGHAGTLPRRLHRVRLFWLHRGQR